MKVSGFTFIKNAVQYEYPVVEAIGSILPLCDEVMVAVGDSSDGTRELISSIGSDKIRIHRYHLGSNAARRRGCIGR
jgi:glycosyltransferase involved in cell wall biosynthesis